MVDQPDTRRADADAGPDEGGARVRVVRFEEQFGELLADDPQQAAEVVARCLVAATRRHLQLLPPATTGGGSGPRREVVERTSLSSTNPPAFRLPVPIGRLLKHA